MIVAINPECIERHYQVISRIGNLGESPAEGFLRAGYSAQETEAMKYFEGQATALGLSARWDRVGNLFLETYSDPGMEFVETGSHLDTVPFGGNFDGAAGVVAGFEAIRFALESGIRLKRGLRLRIWRAEESATYGVVYGGSSAAFGQLDPVVLQNQFNGVTLEQAMRSQGVDPEIIRSRKAIISPEEISRIHAHLEMHIEQGNVLDRSGTDIGVVTSIRGARRLRVILSGEFDHSGATPMGRKYRCDVNLAMAHMLVRLDAHAGGKLAEGIDLVQTVGVINSERDFCLLNTRVYRNAITKVSGFGYFTLDIRSTSDRARDSHILELEEILRVAAEEFGVTVHIEQIGQTAAVAGLDGELQRLVLNAAATLGFSAISMPSGGGHDCVVVSRQKREDGKTVPVGMIFIPCRGGKSHSPDEFASSEAIARGAAVIAETMLSLARQ